jgi:hypothetical protein
LAPLALAWDVSLGQDYQVTFKVLMVGGALVAGFVLAQSASAAVVLSDNFNSDPQQLNDSGDSVFVSLPGTSNASTDIVSNGAPYFLCAPGQGDCVDLDGSTGNGNDPAGILQSKALVGAGTYTLSFDLQGNERGAAAQTTVVTLGATPIASIKLGSSDPYKLYSYTFTTTASGYLTFTEHGPVPQGSDQQGNVLDNVVLSSGVPEPAAWALMLVGLGAMGVALRSRRRIASAA